MNTFFKNVRWNTLEHKCEFKHVWNLILNLKHQSDWFSQIFKRWIFARKWDFKLIVIMPILARKCGFFYQKKLLWILKRWRWRPRVYEIRSSEWKSAGQRYQQSIWSCLKNFLGHTLSVNEYGDVHFWRLKSLTRWDVLINLLFLLIFFLKWGFKMLFEPWALIGYHVVHEKLFENLTEYFLHLEMYIDCSLYMPSPCGFYLNICSMSVTWLNLSHPHFPTSRAHIPKRQARWIFSKKFWSKFQNRANLPKNCCPKVPGVPITRAIPSICWSNRVLSKS